MSIEKITAEFAPVTDRQPPGSRRELPAVAPDQQADLLSLQVEDDAGGDPYNRTGQHCLADLKKRPR